MLFAIVLPLTSMFAYTVSFIRFPLVLVMLALILMLSPIFAVILVVAMRIVFLLLVKFSVRLLLVYMLSPL